MDDKEYRDIKRRLMKLESMIEMIYDSTVVDKKKCPICNNEIRLYTPFGERLRSNAKCPMCGSLERHRALWLYLEKNNILHSSHELKILHFAPEKCLMNKIKSIENVDYYPVDYNPDYEGIRDVVDVTEIPYESNKFDLIICNHVLEHVENEKLALSELNRVLSKNGSAILNVPIDVTLDKTLENEDYNTPETRLKYYGQEDHVRLYGNDYAERLRNAGFKVEIITPNSNYSNDKLKEWGLVIDERIYKCKKI